MMKRYDMVDHGEYYQDCSMEEAAGGDYVKYEDHVSKCNEIRNDRDALFSKNIELENEVVRLNKKVKVLEYDLEKADRHINRLADMIENGEKF